MSTDYDLLAEQLRARGVDVEQVEAALRAQEVETPSWAFGNSGTRFAVFAAARRAAATRSRSSRTPPQVHRHTGVAPSVALHIPWDRVDDFGAAARVTRPRSACASARSTRTSSRSPSTSSAASATRTQRVRRRAIDHLLECIEIAGQTGSELDLALARRRHELPGPGLALRAPRAARRVAAGGLRSAARRDRAARRVQALRAGVLRHRPRRLGLGAHALPGARRPRARCSSTSATTPRASTSSRSSRCSGGWTGSAASTSTTASTATTT